MLKIIQSNQIERLFDHLLTAYRQPENQRSIFEPFQVIVPSKVMGEWLKKQVADEAGISTLVTTEFWGRYFLSLMQRVLRTYAHYQDNVLAVPEVAMLAKNVMQWQIFGFLLKNKHLIIKNQYHPLYPFISPMVEEEKTMPSSIAKPTSLDGDIDMAWANNQSLLANASITENAQLQTFEQRIWQFANDMATMLNRYMTYRPQWLALWGQNTAVAVEEMIAQKDSLHNRLNNRHGDAEVNTPDWLIEHYVELEAAQRYLWLNLFDDDYRYREQMHEQFWQALSHEDNQIYKACRSKLPNKVFLFTLQQLPPSELLDLQRLGDLMDVVILHFNPSEQFWADIVDKTWLMQQQLNNPSASYLQDYGHTLLSRFGKQSREVFAMLASLSGNEYETVMWEDDFIDKPPQTLLQFLQHDILMLQEKDTSNKIGEMLELIGKQPASNSDTASKPNVLVQLNQKRKQLQQQLLNIQSSGIDAMAETSELLAKLQAEFEKQKKTSTWQANTLDTSIAIHVCHSLVRQLEILRSMIVGWLNYSDYQQNPEFIPTDPWQKRALSDILVLLPDIESHQNIIEAIFPKTIGADGYLLPAKVTGVVAKDINQLWQAMTGYYSLLNRVGSRFNRAEVFDWLMLAPLYESFGLNLEQMSRACDLLQQAGFVRGFDEAHLQQTLNDADDDYRYTFAYALERLVAGVLMPKAMMVQFGEYTNRFGEIEKIAPLTNLTMADVDIVAVLCDIYQTLHSKRNLGTHTDTVQGWLTEIEQLIQQKFAIFNQTTAWRAIFAAQNELKNNLNANDKKLADSSTQNPEYQPLPNSIDTKNLPLKLSFVLENIAQQIMNQQVSAEPSGVITFARIGTVRNLPYDLIVMLNLNLSEFPKQEQHNRYNLMQAGLPSRGDRFREDDDLGAFLDALLCARQACWLFYNGKSTLDTHEHLPASPVQELIEFLQQKITDENNGYDKKQEATPTSTPIIETTETSLSKKTSSFEQQAKNYLINHHAALPFDKDYFEIATTGTPDSNEVLMTNPTADQTLQHHKLALFPPAKIWYNLYTTLQNKSLADSPQPTINRVKLWEQPQLQQWLERWLTQKSQFDQLSDELQQCYDTLTHIYRVLSDPAKGFIRQQNIFVNQFEDTEQQFEPLVLDNLGKYQLSKMLMDNLLATDPTDTGVSATTNELMTLMGEILPAGVNRYQSLQQTHDQLSKDLVTFVNNLQQLDTELGEQSNQLLGNLVERHFADIGDNAQQTIHALANAITPVEEQRLAIKALVLDADGQLTTSKQTWVITALLPTLSGVAQSDNNHTSDKSPAYWLNYLPNSGKEKYQLQFWLHHLCWQVIRRTTEQQAANNDGFSLWQYSHKKTYYLPAIACEQAYAYLQDIIMLYQLIGKTVTILPPAVSINYLTAQAKKPDEPPSKLIGEWSKNNDFNSNFVEVNQFDYPIWQQLIGEHKPSVIISFIQTLGVLIYQPLVEQLKELTAVVTNSKPS